MDTPKRNASSKGEDSANNLAGECVLTPMYHPARQDPIKDMKDTLGIMDALLRGAQQALRVPAAQYVQTTPSPHPPPTTSNDQQHRVQALQLQLDAAEQRAREAEEAAAAAEARAAKERRRADAEASAAAAAREEAERRIQEVQDSLDVEVQGHARAENEASDARRGMAKLEARVLAAREAATRAEGLSRLLEEQLELERSRVDALGRPQAVAFGACQVPLADGTMRPANFVAMRDGEQALELTEETGKQWYLLLPEDGSGPFSKGRCMALNVGNRAGDMAQLDRCRRNGKHAVHLPGTDAGTEYTFNVCWQHSRKIFGRINLQEKAAGTVVG